VGLVPHRLFVLIAQMMQIWRENGLGLWWAINKETAGLKWISGHLQST
jgi:hypothetical protein